MTMLRRSLVRTFLSLTLFAALCASVGFAQEASPLAKNANALQALLGDGVKTVVRCDFDRIDFESLEKGLGEIFKGLPGDAEKNAAQREMFSTILSTAAERGIGGLKKAGVHESYTLMFAEGDSISVFPSAGLSDENKKAISAYLAQTSPDFGLVERFGFLIPYKDKAAAERVKTLFEKANETPRPAVVAGLAACEGVAVTVVPSAPADIFTIPRVGKISPLSKEQEERLTYATLSLSLVGSPRAVVLMKASDEAAMGEISDAVGTLLAACKENDSIVAKTVGEELKKQGAEREADMIGKLIASVAGQITPQTEKDQMALTLALIPALKELIAAMNVVARQADEPVTEASAESEPKAAAEPVAESKPEPAAEAAAPAAPEPAPAPED